MTKQEIYDNLEYIADGLQQIYGYEKTLSRAAKKELEGDIKILESLMEVIKNA